jgi:biotin carboxylase
VPPRVAVLHSPRSFDPLDLLDQVGDTAELLWVIDADMTEDRVATRLLGRLGTVIDVAGLSPEAAVAVVGGHRPDGIVTFVDDHLQHAAALAAGLGLPYHRPEVAATLMDKRLQRLALDRGGVPGPRYWVVGDELTSEQVAEVAAEVAYPVVLKPAQGSGSRGIRPVASAEELVAGWEADTGGSGYLLEEYLRGDPDHSRWFADYFSVESVVSRGHSSHVAITGRFPLAPPFRETGNFIPGILEPRLREPVLEVVDDAIQALGITDAIIHTEIKLVADGPKVIEVNGRLGGRPPFVLHDVSDVNLFQAACLVALGQPVGCRALAECTGVGFWLMLQPPMWARQVAAVDGLPELSALPGVDSVRLTRPPGSPADWSLGTDSQVVTVRGRVADHPALAEMVEVITQTVSIGYTDSALLAVT